MGKRAIAKLLNDRCIPAFRGRNGWHHSSVQRILQNPAVIGHYQAYTRDIDDEGVRHYEKAGAVIENHFPVVIEPDTYWTAQGAIQGRSKNAAGRHGASNANVLRGLCKCLVCGSGLTYINKGRLGGHSSLHRGAARPMHSGVSPSLSGDRVGAIAIYPNAGFWARDAGTHAG